MAAQILDTMLMVHYAVDLVLCSSVTLETFKPLTRAQLVWTLEVVRKNRTVG